MKVSWRRAQFWAPWALLLPATHSCGPRREVFETPDSSAAAVGGLPTLSFGGSITTAGTASGGFGTAGGACAVDADCGDATVCIANQCVFCGHAAEECFSCAAGLEPVRFARNGCTACECAARGECSESSECAAGELCHAGNFCTEGCVGPGCCYGNACGPAACAGQPLPCVLGGCPGNAQCEHSCIEPVCECEAEHWRCFDAAASTAGAGGAASGANDCQGVCVSR